MSCIGQTSNTCKPDPPREWSRFENPCTYVPPQTVDPNSLIYVPLLGKNVTVAEAAYLVEIYKKGNVLQYKANSSNITKQQRYAQIARGMWTNRTTTWATQSETYSNPNTQSLRRINYTTIPLNPGTTGNSQTLCPPLPVTPQYNVVPVTITPENVVPSPNPDPPPPIIPLPEEPPSGQSDKVMPPYEEPVAPPPVIVIPDGGTLICSQVENICTGDIIRQLSGIVECTPTTASDVPGEPQLLCWNEGDETYYPRQRLTYGTSGDKWPVNNKLWGTNLCQTGPPPPPVSPVIPFDVVIITASPGNNNLYLDWNANNGGSEIITFTFIIERVGDISVPFDVVIDDNPPPVPENNSIILDWSANDGSDTIDYFTFDISGP